MYLWLSLLLFILYLIYSVEAFKYAGLSAILTIILVKLLSLNKIASFVIFIILLLTIMFVKKYKTDQNISLTGSHITLNKPIINGQSEIFLNNKIWTVSGPDLPLGSLVTIIAEFDNFLLVKPYEQ